MEESLIVLGSILALLLILYAKHCIATHFYFAACEKGYDDKVYYWYPFLLDIVGYLLVIALPDKKLHCAEAKAAHDEPRCAPAQSKASDGAYYCGSCGMKWTYGNSKCQCGSSSKVYKKASEVTNNDTAMKNSSPLVTKPTGPLSKDVPYFCGKCGKPGPFKDDRCECGSGMKMYSTSEES